MNINTWFFSILLMMSLSLKAYAINSDEKWVKKQLRKCVPAMELYNEVNDQFGSTLKISYISTDEMNKISRIGTAASDPTTGKIIILDSSSKAEKIEALLFELANLKAHRKSNELKRNICQYTSEEFVYEVESIEFESNRLVNSIIDSCRKIEGFDVKALLRFSSLEEAISYLQKVGHTNHYVDYHHHNCN